MRQLLKYIALLALAVFSKCSSPADREKSPEQIASYIANNIDSNSLQLLQTYSYARRGDTGFWLKLREDSNLYACSYGIERDTVALTVFQPLSFVKDFPCTFQLDTTVYHKYTFLKHWDTIIRIIRVDKYGQDHKQDTFISVNKLFPKQNPFLKFGQLSALQDKMGFIGTSYRSDIGDFIEFWITPQYKLIYLPDTLSMNPRSKKYWLEDFARGKKIKEHWSLSKVY